MVPHAFAHVTFGTLHHLVVNNSVVINWKQILELASLAGKLEGFMLCLDFDNDDDDVADDDGE